MPVSNKPLITQEQLRQIVSYDPKTGNLIWIQPGKKRVVGKPAGCLGALGYMEVGIGYRRYLVHRLVWLWHHGEFPPEHTDHLNHERSDNRIENLRAVTNQQNNFNQSKRIRPASSRYRGVDWVQKRGSWRARFTVGRISTHLGYYPDEGTAAMVWNDVAATEYGEHANLNTAE